MDTFILKHSHRYRALALAVDRITTKQTNPLYERRDTLVNRILSESWTILREASLDHDGYRDFVAAGLATRTDHIAIDGYAPQMVGRYGWHNNIQIWSSVIEQVSRGTLLSFAASAKTAHQQTGEVVSFHHLKAWDRLPQASLTSALSLAGGADRPDLAGRQARIRDLIDTDLALLNRQIEDCYADLPTIADSFSSCHTSEDLLRIFPAARVLFGGNTPAIDPRAQQILATL